MSRLTIITKGKTEHGEEHQTIIENPNGEMKRFYTDGYEGISFKDITDILDFVGVGYFVVHKN